MPLKKSKGHMYEWVTHTHCHLGGECQHFCSYCYVDNQRWGRPPCYSGDVCLMEKEFTVRYDEKNLARDDGEYPGVIFIEHKNDICGPGVTTPMQTIIINHCKKWPDNTYVFQSKNPRGFATINHILPESCIVGTTIETNRIIPESISKAPATEDRMWGLRNLDWPRTFVTIEPVMDFDVDILAGWISDIRPEFLNLGADSKNHNLPEPTVEKIHKLVDKLAEYGIELREKSNLSRLKQS